MNLKEWLGSKKTKNALVGVMFVGACLAMMLHASGGEPQKFAALLEAAKPYVWGAIGLLGVTNVGQSAVDTKLASK